MESVKNYFESNKENQLFYQWLFLFAMIIVGLLSILTKRFLFFIALALCIIASLFFIYSKEFVDEKKAWKQYRVYIFTLFFFILFGSKAFFSTLPFGKNFFWLVTTFLALIIMLIFSFPKKKSEMRTNIESFLTGTMYGDIKGIHEGDTVWGYDVETKEPHIIPLKDRYLHGLILGKTGTAKSSQAFLPAIERDLNCKSIGVVVLEPKGDLAEKVYAMAKIKGRTDVTYFNPSLEDCPYFNPLIGNEDDVIENMVTAFSALENESQTFFKNMNEMLLRRCIRVVKRLYKNDATFRHINVLMNNVNKEGDRMLEDFIHLPVKSDNEDAENKEIYSWFKMDYLTGLSGERSATKTYEQCSGVRNQIAKLLANRYVSRILCPPNSSELKEGEFIDFQGILERGGVLCMCPAQGKLRELAEFLGYFLILSFESAVFRRPGDENTRRGVMFYVDEFQKFSNEGYQDMLTQGRSYRVASILATQSRAGIALNAGSMGNRLTELITANCRNVMIFGDTSYEDADYYSKAFGEIKKSEEKVSYSRGRGLLQKYNYADQRESVHTEERWEPRFRPGDIMDETKFGYGIVRTIYNNSATIATKVSLNFIDEELNQQVNDYIETFIRPKQLNIDTVDDSFTPYSGALIDDFDDNEIPEVVTNKFAVTSPDKTEYVNAVDPMADAGEGDYGDEFDIS